MISVARMVDATMPNMAAQLGEFLYEKIFELMNKRKKTASAAATTVPPAPATAAPDIAAPTMPISDVPIAGAPTALQAQDSVGPIETTPVARQIIPTEEQPATAARNATGIPAATPPVLTPAQIAHLVAIRQRLDAKERAIAEAAIQKMTPAQLARWLGELSALSVEDATMTIRDLITQIRPTERSQQP